jgi:hypothetical protein
LKVEEIVGVCLELFEDGFWDKNKEILNGRDHR